MASTTPMMSTSMAEAADRPSIQRWGGDTLRRVLTFIAATAVSRRRGGDGAEGKGEGRKERTAATAGRLSGFRWSGLLSRPPAMTEAVARPPFLTLKLVLPRVCAFCAASLAYVRARPRLT